MKARLVALLAAIPTTAFAHPGHGQTDPDGWTHYLTEPVHVAVIGAAVALAVAVGVSWRRSRSSRRSP